MRRDVISTCPVCDHELSVTRLHCNECGTTLEGEFTVGRFGRLDREQLALLLSFLRSRGNLREMERELGLSYPTVRSRVDGLVRALGLASGDTDAGAVRMPAARPAGPSAAERRRVLEQLARREISAEEAAHALRGEERTPPPSTAPPPPTTPPTAPPPPPPPATAKEEE